MITLLRNTRRPDISFYRNGRIDITARTAKLIGIKDGDVIDIAVDNGEYYVYVRHKAECVIGRHEAQCYRTNRRSVICNNLRAHSIRLCAMILSIHNDANAVRLPVGEPQQHAELGCVLPIIVRNNIKKYD